MQAPRHIWLHGSRSGQLWSVKSEFDSTRGYARRGANGLGWGATAGEGEYSVHYNARRWGHNIRELSDDGQAIEFAQSRLGVPISDRMVWTAACYIHDEVFAAFPSLNADNVVLLEHWETAPGRRDGKSDIDPSRPGELAGRVRDELRRLAR